MLKSIPPRDWKWQGRGSWWAFSDADAWHGATRIRISYIYIYLSLFCLSWKHCTADLWSEQVTICSALHFFPQQATCTCKNKSASYSKPSAQMLRCHTIIFIGVHWGTLNDFYSHSRLMKVRCCKFICSKILVRWWDGGTAEEWTIPEMSFSKNVI